jgi:hypothetical protein
MPAFIQIFRSVDRDNSKARRARPAGYEAQTARAQG